MTQRLNLVANQLAGKREPKQGKPVMSSLDFCFFDDLLNPEEVALRKKVREFAEKDLAPLIPDAYEKAELPDSIISAVASQDLVKLFIKKPYGEDKNAMQLGITVMELARVDASVSTFFCVQLGLAMFTLDSFASDEQKKRLFPDMCKLKIISGWGLTEPDIGSDASSLQSRVKKVEGGYVLNGGKRWIGNGAKDMIVCWARNEDSKQVEAFIVPTSSPGYKAEIIKNKMALRIVQNAHITFDNVFIPDSNRLPKADQGFLSTNVVLEHSRIFVCWIAAGLALGVYDNVMKYADNRKQFGVKITSFQLQQEKLARMMGHIQGILLLCWRITRLYEQKKLTIGRAAMAKAWTSRLCREICGLGREILGGNGIIHDNYAMKALGDVEAVITYEGTYDINVLVAARELTGFAAFK